MTQRRGPTGAAGREPPLLPTKLRAPHAGRRVLPRPNLLDQLSLAAEQRRLTIVSAPPGWGKTTLLTEWCAQVEPESRCAWVGLDRADADPIRFWTYIVESLRTVAPQIGNTALRLLAARGTSVAKSRAPSATTTMMYQRPRGGKSRSKAPSVYFLVRFWSDLHCSGASRASSAHSARCTL